MIVVIALLALLTGSLMAAYVISIETELRVDRPISLKTRVYGIATVVFGIATLAALVAFWHSM